MHLFRNYEASEERLGLNGGRIAFWMTVLRRLLGGSMAYSMLVGIVERCHREGAD